MQLLFLGRDKLVYDGIKVLGVGALRRDHCDPPQSALRDDVYASVVSASANRLRLSNSVTNAKDNKDNCETMTAWHSNHGQNIWVNASWHQLGTIVTALS